MFTALLAVIAGIAALVYSADVFIDGAVSVARKFHVPKMIIGMLIIGIGTSMPEIVVSVLAALEGSPGLSLGNAYGSNIVNIALVLGATLLISPIHIRKGVVRFDFPVLLGVSAFAVWQLLDGTISRPDGIVLILVLAAVLFVQIRMARQSARDSVAQLDAEAAEVLRAINPRRALVKLVIGLIVLVLSSRLIVWGAVKLAALWGISELVIGLTIVAIGTSLPEMVSSIIAARRGEHEMALGNVLGSNIFNTLAVVGTASVVSPFAIAPEILTRDVPVMCALTVALFAIAVVARRGSEIIGRASGAALLACFAGYTAWLMVGV